MHPQTAVRTDQLRPFVPVPRTSPPPTSHGLDGASEREPLAQSMHLMGAVMSYPRNAEIFGENEPAEYLYKVISGSVRTYKILSDGRRQIGGFYLPGDIFGFQFAEEHTFSAEAITDAKVLGCRLIKSTIQEQRPDRQRPSNFAPVCRSGWRCA